MTKDSWFILILMFAVAFLQVRRDREYAILRCETLSTLGLIDLHTGYAKRNTINSRLEKLGCKELSEPNYEYSHTHN